jgi:hypothetical protein
MIIILAPFFCKKEIVGIVLSILKVEIILPFLIGTLKSARSRTLLPDIFFNSLIVFILI